MLPAGHVPDGAHYRRCPGPGQSYAPVQEDRAGHHRSRLYLLQRRYPARFHEDCRQQAGRTGEDLRFYPSSGQHL